MANIDQLLHATEFIYEHIKLADQKALVFIALNGSLIGYLYNIEVLQASGLVRALSIIAFLLLLTATVLALWTIRPRRAGYGRGEGVIDPERVVKFNNSETYLQHLRSMNDGSFEQEVSERIFDLCRVDHDKYQWLNGAVILSGVAWVTALVVLWQWTHSGGCE